jgi:hypothetical protein
VNIEEKIYSVLSGAAAVTALVPAARIKVPGGHQNLTRPYIIHFPVGVDPIYTHGGLRDLRKWDFYQVSCYADSHSSARAVAVAVRNALGNYRADRVVSFWQNDRTLPYDDETRVHHIAVEFSVFESLQ